MRTRQQVQTVCQYFRERAYCDFCKEEIKSEYGYRDDEVEIQGKFGDVFPDGDHRETLYLDCCPSCFTRKVKPALEALGATWHRETDRSYGNTTSTPVPLGLELPDTEARSGDFPGE